MQNAVCGWSAEMQQAGVTNTHPLLATHRACVPQMQMYTAVLRTTRGEDFGIIHCTLRPREGQGFAYSHTVKP